MSEIKEELLLNSLALRLTMSEVKELYSNAVISPEQYITLTELISNPELSEMNKTNKIQKLLELEKIANQQAELERFKREEKKRKVNKKIGTAESEIKQMLNLDDSQKRKGKKYIIISFILLVFLAIVSFCYAYLMTNVLGFIDVDLANYAIVEYDQSGFTTQPSIYGNWTYYNENGYYNDAIETLVNSGVYNKEEAIEKMPDESSLKVSNIVSGYDLSTNNPVEDGETVEVTIQYSEDAAKQQKLNVVNNKFSFTVGGLRQQLTTADFDDEVLATLSTSNDAVISKVIDSAWSYDSGDIITITSHDYYAKFSDENEDATIYNIYEVRHTDPVDKSNFTYYTVYQNADYEKQGDQIRIVDGNWNDPNQLTFYSDPLDDFLANKDLTKITTGGN